MHFFAGIGSLFVFIGITLFAGLSVLHFFPLIKLSVIPFGIAGGFCILIGVLLAAIGLLGELIVTLSKE